MDEDEPMAVQVHSGNGPAPGQKCPHCYGIGFEITEEGNPELLRDCPHCDGTGETL